VSRKVILLFLSLLFLATGCIGEKKAVEEKVYTIGILWMNPALDAVAGFKDGMRELGYIEGENLVYDYKNAMGSREEAKRYADEFVDKKVDLLFVGTTPGTLIAKEATRSTGIPVLFTIVTDPVGAGIVESIESSGNNIAGVCTITEGSKRLELLFEILPEIKRLGVIYNPRDQSPTKIVAQFREGLKEENVELVEAHIQSTDDIAAAVNSLVGRVDAIMVPPDSTVMANLAPIINASNEHGIPVGMPNRMGVEAGGLFAISADYYELGKMVARMADKVFKGVTPRDMPLEFPDRYVISVNLKAAQKLNITIPQSVLKRADYVIK
jgi:putative ABC transport system substrate-binding protein